MKIKTKINKWDLIVLKSMCTAQETIRKQKDKSQNRRKYLERSNKGSISIICKQLMQLNIKTIDDPIKNWCKTYIDISPKKTYT